MTYADYTKKYYRYISRMVKLGLTYARKVFWRLTKRQYQHYQRAQFAAMRRALQALHEEWAQ